MTNLFKLDLSYSSIISLFDFIGRLENLKEIYLSCTEKLTSLSEEIGNLSKLGKLDVSQSNMVLLPNSIGNLANLH